MVGFAEFNRKLTRLWDSLGTYEKDLTKRFLINRLVNVMSRETFIASINEGTMRVAAVKARFDPWFHALETFFKDTDQTLEDAKTLFAVRQQNQNLCGYCNTNVPEEEAVLTNVENRFCVSHLYCYQSRH